MVLTRSQRLALEREEQDRERAARHKEGIFTDEDEAEAADVAYDVDTAAAVAAGLNDTPRGKGCRVVRPQLTFEEEQQIEIYHRKVRLEQRRQLQYLKERNIPAPSSSRGSGGGAEAAEAGDSSAVVGISGRRPEREAARRAMELFAGGGSSSSEDELMRMPGKKKSSANANTMVTYRKSGGGGGDDDEDILLQGHRDDGTVFGGDRAARDQALANGRRMTINQQINKFISADRKGFREGAGNSSYQSNSYYGLSGTGGADAGGADGVGGFGAAAGGGGNDSDRENARHKLADVQPIEVDRSTTFAQVGGLPSHILTLRETVLIPLLYPKLLSQLKIKPPRGVLFVGPPGTGKTLMARALAAEGSRAAGGGKKVSFFLRKGADMLSKWMGESEKQLRMLFEEARKHQPSIIFFDEIDGLAPIRHGKQDQSYAALVSTLLALLDGLTDRGQVVVIGATNRPDTLDPALRRPGRFDRELRFPMPDVSGRRQIIDIHMKGQSVSGGSAGKAAIREAIVKKTSGWSGADLQSLCTAASLHALRRSVPQIYVSKERLRVPLSMVKVKPLDYEASLLALTPSAQRVSSGGAAASYVPRHVEALLDEAAHAALGALGAVWAPSAAALERSELEARALKNADQTRQLVFALTTQLIPQLAATPQAAVMLLTACPQQSPTEADRLFIATHTAKSVVSRLPTMYSRTVHMPNIGRGGGGGGGGGKDAADAVAAATDNPADRNLFVMPGDDAPSSVAELFSAMRACTPGLLLLLGFEEWAATASDEALSNFKYNLTTIAQCDVALLIPLGYAPVSEAEEKSVKHLMAADGRREADSDDNTNSANANAPSDEEAALVRRLATKAIVNDLFALPGLASTVARLSEPQPSAKATVLEELHTTYTQAEGSVRRQVEALGYLGANAPTANATTASSSSPAGAAAASAGTVGQHHQQQQQMPWPSLPVDDGNGDSDDDDDANTNARGGGGKRGGKKGAAAAAKKKKRLTPQDKRRALDEWALIEHRRRELRHTLYQWVSGYLTNKKYQFLLTGDLDFTPEHEYWASWQRHIRGKKVGLQDIAARIEHEEYTALSAFSEDIEQLCANVRTFFANHESRYRPKAVELKESTLLNTYKLRRGLIVFCEETKNATEPIFDDADGESDSSSSSSSSDEEATSCSDSEAAESDGAMKEAAKAAPLRPPAAPKQPAAKRRKRAPRWSPRKKKRPAPKRAREESSSSSPSSAEDDDADVDVDVEGEEEFEETETDVTPQMEASAAPASVEGDKDGEVTTNEAAEVHKPSAVVELLSRPTSPTASAAASLFPIATASAAAAATHNSAAVPPEESSVPIANVIASASACSNPSRFVTPPPPGRSPTTSTASGDVVRATASTAAPAVVGSNGGGGTVALAATVPRPPVPTRLFGLPNSMVNSGAFQQQQRSPVEAQSTANASSNAFPSSSFPPAVGPTVVEVTVKPSDVAAVSSSASASAGGGAVPPALQQHAPTRSTDGALHAPAPLPAPQQQISAATSGTLSSATGKHSPHPEPLSAAAVSCASLAAADRLLPCPTLRRRFFALTALQLHQMLLLAAAWAHAYKRLKMHALFGAPAAAGGLLGPLPATSPTQYDPPQAGGEGSAAAAAAASSAVRLRYDSAFTSPVSASAAAAGMGMGGLSATNSPIVPAAAVALGCGPLGEAPSFERLVAEWIGVVTGVPAAGDADSGEPALKRTRTVQPLLL